MSATQSWSGPSAEKSRFTRSGAALAQTSRFIVPVLKRLRVTPSMPNSTIRRATRLRLTRSPCQERRVDPRAAVDPAALDPLR